ncbi:hypothetical protein Tco_0623459 [Tanacetum coccineum]
MVVSPDRDAKDVGSDGGDTGNGDDTGRGVDGICGSGYEYDVSGDGCGVDMARNLSTFVADRNGIGSPDPDSHSCRWYNMRGGQSSDEA